MAVRRRHIRSLVESLLEREGIRSAPVNVERIAVKLGMIVKKRPAEDSLSGFLARDPETGAMVLGVNSKHHVNRQRFTVAHEIAHFLLHQGESIHVDKGQRIYQVNRDGKSSEGVDKYEIEANLFAAELLMPATLLAKDIVKLAGKDLMDDKVVSDLAKTYQVSVQSLTHRLAYLNYVSH